MSQWIIKDVARSVPFDNSTNGFSSTDVQSAIEELKSGKKAGVITAGTFSGDPKKATVTFTTAYVDVNYAIVITGVDARSWTYESKLATGFTINTNANKALTGEVSWECAYQGST